MATSGPITYLVMEDRFPSVAAPCGRLPNYGWWPPPRQDRRNGPWPGLALGALAGWPVLAQPAADPLDGLVRLRHQPGERVPDMRHLRPDFERHVDARSPCRRGE